MAYEIVDPFEIVPNAKPNQAIALPAGRGRAKRDLVVPVFAVPAAELERAVVAFAAEQPRTERVEVVAPKRLYGFVERSRLFRFPDLLSLHVIEIDEGKSSFGLHSRSLVGYADFGVNRRRVRAWLDGLATRLPLA